MSAHTPGPWKLRGKDGRFLSSDEWDVRNDRTGSLHWVCVKAGKRVIAIVPATGMPEGSKVTQDAALIAAAPDGLALARRFLDFAKSGAAFNYPPGSLQELEAFVAKAEGRS